MIRLITFAAAALLMATGALFLLEGNAAAASIQDMAVAELAAFDADAEDADGLHRIPNLRSSCARLAGGPNFFVRDMTCAGSAWCGVCTISTSKS